MREEDWNGKGAGFFGAMGVHYCVETTLMTMGVDAVVCEEMNECHGHDQCTHRERNQTCVVESRIRRTVL